MATAPDIAILSVRLKSGEFESSVSIPLDRPKEARDEAVKKWLKMIAFALENGVTDLAANLDARTSSEETPTNG